MRKGNLLFKLLLGINLILVLPSCTKQDDGIVIDPGESGKKTVEGIDKDKDGVRDDLQVWIQQEFGNSESIREAVREMAKTHPASCDFKHKTGCLEILVGFDEALRIEIELMERFLNTQDRQKDFEAKLQTCHFSEELTQQKCPFDVAELKN